MHGHLHHFAHFLAMYAAIIAHDHTHSSCHSLSMRITLPVSHSHALFLYTTTIPSCPSYPSCTSPPHHSPLTSILMHTYPSLMPTSMHTHVTRLLYPSPPFLSLSPTITYPFFFKCPLPYPSSFSPYPLDPPLSSALYPHFRHFLTSKKNHGSVPALQRFRIGNLFVVASDNSFIVRACDDVIKIVDSSNASTRKIKV